VAACARRIGSVGHALSGREPRHELAVKDEKQIPIGKGLSVCVFIALR
jgi:hypothetical protein